MSPPENIEKRLLPGEPASRAPTRIAPFARIAHQVHIDGPDRPRRRWLLGAILLMAMGCGRFGFDSEERTWGELGDSATDTGISNSDVPVRTTRLAINARDEIFVAWTDSRTGNADVYLSHWSGSEWLGIGRSLDSGGISADTGESLAGSIAFDAMGRPAITWRAASADGGSPRSVYLRQWNGADWSELVGSATGRGVSVEHNPWWPKTIVDSDSRLVVAWETYNVPGTSGGVVHLRRFDGTSWVELAGSASGGGVSEDLGNAQGVSMAAGPDGTLVVAWADNRDGARNIYLRQWTGSEWRDLGGSHTGSGISQSAAESSRVHVANTASDRPVVAWLEHTGSPDEAIHLRRWDGFEWRELDGSASGTGVNGSVSPAYNPALAVDSQGDPVVVWQSQESGVENVHGRRWNGVTWEALGLDESISNTPRASSWPAVAVDSQDRVVVVWEEDVGTDRCGVYLRRYE